MCVGGGIYCGNLKRSCVDCYGTKSGAAGQCGRGSNEGGCCVSQGGEGGVTQARCDVCKHIACGTATWQHCNVPGPPARPGLGPWPPRLRGTRTPGARYWGRAGMLCGTWIKPKSRAVNSGTTSDCRYQSAADQHGHCAQHSARRAQSGIDARNAWELVQK